MFLWKPYQCHNQVPNESAAVRWYSGQSSQKNNNSHNYGVLQIHKLFLFKVIRISSRRGVNAPIVLLWSCNKKQRSYWLASFLCIVMENNSEVLSVSKNGFDNM